MFTTLYLFIPRVRIGYEMVDTQWGLYCQVGYNHLISNKQLLFYEKVHKQLLFY